MASANTAPIFTLPPANSTPVVLSATADTSYTAPTHTVTVFTAGLNGSRIEEVDLFGTGVTVAGVVQFFLYDGSAYHAIDSVLVTVVTPSTTQPPFVYKLTFLNLVIPSGWSLRASSWVASQLLSVVAYGGDF